ncbi:MAG: beta-propeller domain-containing protein [Candidatus Anstonellaceae archaeon]
MVKKFLAIAFALFAVSLLLAGCVKPQPPTNPGGSGNNTTVLPNDSSQLKSFTSTSEIQDFLKSASYGGGYYYRGRGFGFPVPTMAMAKAGAAEDVSAAPGASDYSQTNIQVEGVDEADIVKNDGKYIYKVDERGAYENGKQFGKVVIVRAFPPENMGVVSEITFEGSAREIFAYNDKLVVFGSVYRRAEPGDEPPLPPEASQPGQEPLRQAVDTIAGQAKAVASAGVAAPAKMMAQCIDCPPYYYGNNFGFMKVYDISNRAKPKLEKEIEVRGGYINSRMIDGKVYAIFQDAARYDYPLPLIEVDGVKRAVAPTDIKYFDWPDSSYNFDTFIQVDLNDLAKEEVRKTILMGYSQNLYVSKDNMYITYTSYERYYPMWRAYEGTYGAFMPAASKEKIKQIDAMNVSDWRKDRLKVAVAQDFLNAYVYNESYSGKDIISTAAREVLAMKLQSDLSSAQMKEGGFWGSERTAIHKVALSNFAYLGDAYVPGHVLNQFSMDEHNGYFRIATTSGRLSRMGSSTSNNLYVLDSGLKQVGEIEDLAPGESIYSARFMGDRAYLVTFKKVDPFFVLDLSNPEKPKVLGKLKIPGYSDYLHPYDENYVIGLGKGAIAAEEGDFAWYQGVKLSLFDVSDLENPKEVAKFEIGDRGTDSYALHDHKAFLFSKSRNLLVIPVTLAEIDEEKYPRGVEPNTYGDFVFQGAYAFSVTPEGGFKLLGRVSHADDDNYRKSGWYYGGGSTDVKRTLYMDDYLYTISDKYVKANELPGLDAISSVQISDGSGSGPVWY